MQCRSWLSVFSAKEERTRLQNRLMCRRNLERPDIVLEKHPDIAGSAMKSGFLQPPSFYMHNYGESFDTTEKSSNVAETEELLVAASFIIGLPDSDHQ